MLPRRFSVKYFVSSPAHVELSKFVPIFQRWIQRQLVEGLLIDVAAYEHVYQGPGIVLIGDEGDYSLDIRDGRPGLMYTRKRQIDGQLRGKPVKFSPRRVVKLGDLWITLEVTGDAASHVTVQAADGGGKPQELLSKWHPGEPVWSGDINGRPVKVQVQRTLSGYRLNQYSRS